MTLYSSLYPKMRTVLQDYDGTIYQTSWLDGAIDFALEFMDSYVRQAVGATLYVSPEITGNDKVQLICRACLMLLRPQASFNYRTAVLSVTRDSIGINRIINWLEATIMDLEAGGHMPIAHEGSLDDFLDSADKLEDLIEAHSTI